MGIKATDLGVDLIEQVKRGSGGLRFSGVGSWVGGHVPLAEMGKQGGVRFKGGDLDFFW